MKRKTVALYDPYLDVMGGGERHILSILQILEQEGCDITVFWDKDLSEEIRLRLNLQLKSLKFQPNFFSFPSPFEKLQKLSSFDMFFYVTDGSYFFSSAKKNFVFCMVPDKSLYDMGLTNRLKTWNYRFLSNSVYTQQNLNRWGIQSKVIYPYISHEFLDTDLKRMSKEKIILAVGRFFPHLHSKKHDAIVQAFAAFNKKYPDFKLVLAGGLKKEDEGYFEELQTIVAKHKNIVLKPNIPYLELIKLYHSAMFFWHFTGFGVNEEKHPEQVEHLGMTPLEAMATGSVPFCYRAGGPKEFITEGKNGYLFMTQFELLEKMDRLISDQSLYRNMQIQAQQTVRDRFSFKVFKSKITNDIVK